MSFVSTEGNNSVPLRTDDGIFTQEFFDDETITGDVVKAAAVTELQNIRFATAEQNAPSAITQSLDFMLQGVSQLTTDSEENSASAKTEAANAMNLSTSLQAFSNSIPAEFGSAPGTSYNSSFSVQLQNKGVNLATNESVTFNSATVKQPNTAEKIAAGEPSTVTSTITNITNIPGLTITQGGLLSFNPSDAGLPTLTGTQIYSITGTYNITSTDTSVSPSTSKFKISVSAGGKATFESELPAAEYEANSELYSHIQTMQDQLIADITGKTLAQIAETHQAGVEGANQRKKWIAAAVEEGANYSATDFAQIMLNARKFNPQTIAEGGSTVNRVDTALYASTEVDSEQYIGPMDGTFTSGDTTFSYASDNPNPYKFSIDITEAPDWN